MHPAQRDFLQSNATFRAFCGGIGSGKSWAGSYDLIRRAEAGRLYLIVAPTYSMLSDATFRSFLQLAEELGVVDPGQVKRSAPPSIRLRTGAEVLFRSGDDPERLRGPNLSGIWLDEASLLTEDAYCIAIGRLREAGRQGWLTATFTPKGRRHWTYETFATGRPDTALFVARTADNPFLPPGFDATVRHQYTTALAAQELEGQFLDQGGTLFQRDWFAVVEQAPALVSRVRAWDLAATPRDEKKAHDPDWTAGVLLGKDAAGTYYVLDVRRLRGKPAGGAGAGAVHGGSGRHRCADLDGAGAGLGGGDGDRPLPAAAGGLHLPGGAVDGEQGRPGPAAGGAGRGGRGQVAARPLEPGLPRRVRGVPVLAA
jgi:phage terminase large subunit-like protein